MLHRPRLLRIGVVLSTLSTFACGSEATDDSSLGTDGGVTLGRGDSSEPDASRGSMRDGGFRDGSSPNADGSQVVFVERVIDGDTLVVTADDSVRAPDGRSLRGERIRLLGIDAPEIAHGPNEVSECGGPEATEAVRTRLEGRPVDLEYDMGGSLRDPYDRILAYVRDDRGTLNEDLLTEGHARVFRGGTHRYYRRYVALESRAKAAHLGVWACPP